LPFLAKATTTFSKSGKEMMFTSFGLSSDLVLGNWKSLPSKALKSLELCFWGTENNSATCETLMAYFIIPQKTHQ